MRIKGTDLNPAAQRAALARYVHRYTRDHIPEWAKRSGTRYPVQFASDADWLEHTYFHVRADGRLDERYRFCESTPTWPVPHE